MIASNKKSVLTSVARALFALTFLFFTTEGAFVHGEDDRGKIKGQQKQHRHLGKSKDDGEKCEKSLNEMIRLCNVEQS